MTEPDDGYANLQEAVEAFFRSPLPPSPRPAGPAAEAWVPQIADVEKPTVIDVVLDADPWLLFFDPPTEGSYVVLPLAGGTRAVGWEFGVSAAERLRLPEEMAERLQHGDRVRLRGRWAHVRLDPSAPARDDWYSQPGRMFVIDGCELIDEAEPDR